MGGGRAEIGTAITAGGKYRHLCIEDMDRAVFQAPGDDALAGAVLGHDQVDGEIFDVELGIVLQALAVKRVQDRVARAVGRRAGALHGRAFAELGRVAAEGTLVDLTLFRSRKRHPVVLQFIDSLRCLAGEVFHRVGVAQPVRALHRVVHVPLPVVRPHVRQRRGDAALCRDGVRPGREDLGDAGSAQPLLGHAKGRAKARAAGTHDDAVVFVCFVFVCSHGVLRERSWRWRTGRLRPRHRKGRWSAQSELRG